MQQVYRCMSADDVKGQTGFCHYMEARMITWSPNKLPAVINTHEDWGSCLSPLLSPGSMSCYCKLNQGEVCGFPVFPHSDVWGQTGSIYRVWPRFFKESPRPASCNQAAEAYVSGQERWMNSGSGTESSAKTKNGQIIFPVWGRCRKGSVMKRKLRETNLLCLSC